MTDSPVAGECVPAVKMLAACIEFGCSPEEHRRGCLRGEQVCQVHGAPDDLVICPFLRCQLGRVPQWTGYGLPAGTRACTVCNASGMMLRSERQKVFLPPDDTPRLFCICHRIGVPHV